MTDNKTIYTHGYHSSVLRSHSNRTVENSARYLLDKLAPGVSLLDVDSGAGTITADFAERLSPGRVTALEATESSLDLTRTEISRCGLTNVDFVVGDVHILDFPAVRRGANLIGYPRIKLVAEKPATDPEAGVHLCPTLEYARHPWRAPYCRPIVGDDFVQPAPE